MQRVPREQSHWHSVSGVTPESRNRLYVMSRCSEAQLHARWPRGLAYAVSREPRRLQELAEWDDRRGGGSRATVHSVKSISRALAGVRNSPVMVPMLQSFDAGHGCGAGAADGSALDSVVTIQGIDDDVRAAPSTCVSSITCL